MNRHVIVNVDDHHPEGITRHAARSSGGDQRDGDPPSSGAYGSRSQLHVRDRSRDSGDSSRSERTPDEGRSANNNSQMLPIIATSDRHCRDLIGE